MLSACGGGSSGAVAPAALPQASVTNGADPSAVTAAQAVTPTWSAQNTASAACNASGAWSGPLALTDAQVVTPPTAGNATFTIACGSATRSVSVAVAAPPASASNTVAVTLNAGPTASVPALKVSSVSITICRPATSVCQTIDHILVDTGSYGLRLVAPVNAALGLPALAPSKLAGEVAPTQSIQLVGAPQTGAAPVPADCTSIGTNIGTVAALGTNGILGVGLLHQDCGNACATSAISGTYYACTGSTCAATKMQLAQQVSNPVFAFATDNNGIVFTLPAVAPDGAKSLAGPLTFGTGTQTDNMIASEVRYAADSSGNFTTIYRGRTMSASFLDSGSNGLFFNDSTLPGCSFNTDFYCPPAPQTLTAVNQAFDGSASGPISFTLSNVDTLAANVVAAPVGGNNGGRHSTGANAFDWGLPSFFGRRVFVGFEGTQSGPYWAY